MGLGEEKKGHARRVERERGEGGVREKREGGGREAVLWIG